MVHCLYAPNGWQIAMEAATTGLINVTDLISPTVRPANKAGLKLSVGRCG